MPDGLDEIFDKVNGAKPQVKQEQKPASLDDIFETVKKKGTSESPSSVSGGTQSGGFDASIYGVHEQTIIPKPEESKPVNDKPLMANLPEDLQKQKDVQSLQKELHESSVNHQYAKSDAIADMLLQKEPNNAYAHQVKAYNLQQDGSDAEAQKEMQTAISKDPKDVNSYRMLASMAYRAGDTKTAEKASKTYTEAIKSGFGDENTERELSRMYAIQGDEKEAKKHLQTAESIKLDRQNHEDAQTLLDFTDAVQSGTQHVYNVIENTLEAPPKMVYEGGKKIVNAMRSVSTYNANNPIPHEGDVPMEQALPDVISGATTAYFGALSATPVGATFQAVMNAGHEVGADKIIDWGIAPVTKILEASGVDTQKLSPWVQTAVQTGNFLPMLLFARGKGIVKDIGKKLMNREPLSAEEVHTIDETIPTITKPQIDQTVSDVENYGKVKEETPQVIEAQDTHPETPTYSIGNKIYPKEEFIKLRDEAKKNGVNKFDAHVVGDPETKQATDDMFKPQVKPAEPKAEEPTFPHEEKLPANVAERAKGENSIGNPITAEEWNKIPQTPVEVKTQFPNIPEEFIAGAKVVGVDKNYFKGSDDPAQKETADAIDHKQFSEGGNDKAYPNFVPDKTIIFDNTQDDIGQQGTIVHEGVERQLMEKGLVYNNAHEIAAAVEEDFREGRVDEAKKKFADAMKKAEPEFTDKDGTVKKVSEKGKNDGINEGINDGKKGNKEPNVSENPQKGGKKEPKEQYSALKAKANIEKINKNNKNAETLTKQELQDIKKLMSNAEKYFNEKYDDAQSIYNIVTDRLNGEGIYEDNPVPDPKEQDNAPKGIIPKGEKEPESTPIAPEKVQNLTKSTAKDKSSSSEKTTKIKPKKEGEPDAPKITKSEKIPLGEQAGGSKEDGTGHPEGEEVAKKETESKVPIVQSVEDAKKTIGKFMGEDKKPVSAKIQSLIDKLEKAKITKKLDDPTSMGVSDVDLFNSAITAAQEVLGATQDIAKALEAGYAKLKNQGDKDKLKELLSEEEEKEEPTNIHLVAANAFADAIAGEKFGAQAVQSMIDALPKGESANDILSEILKNIDTKDLETNRKNILEGKPSISKEVQAKAVVDLALIKAKDLELRIKKQRAIDEGADDKTLKSIDNEILDNDTAYKDSFLANRAIGTEWGQFGQFRGALNEVTDKFNIVDMEAEYKAKNNIKGDLTDEQKKYIKSQYSGIKDAEANLEKIKQQEAEIEKLKTDKENQEKINTHLNKIIEDYKNKSGKSKEKTKEKVDKADAKIKRAGATLKGLVYGRATALGVLDPSIYKALGEMVAGKVEKFYEETKGKIELKNLLDDTLKEAQKYMPEITKGDIEDAMSGNYKKPKQTKKDLQVAKEDLKKEVKLRKDNPDIEFGEDDSLKDVQDKIDKHNADKKAEKEKKIADEKAQKQSGKQQESAEKKAERQKQSEKDRASKKLGKKQDKLDKEEENKKYEKEKKNKEILKRRYRQIQQVEQDIQNKRYEKDEPKPFRKSDKVMEAERVLDRRKQQWRADRRKDMMKNRPVAEKIADTLNDVIRAFNLSFGGTLLKLGGVVGQNLITKIPRVLVQKGVMKLMPNEIAKYGGAWGDVELRSIANYYVDHIKVFRLETLKRVYGKDYNDPTGELSAIDARFKFLNYPGKTHQLIKEFVKSPELKYSENAQVYQAINNLKEAETKLKDKNMSEKERQKWQDQYDDFDVSNPNVMQRISDQAMADANYQILMNNPSIGGKVKNAFGGHSKNAVVRVAQKVLWRSQNTIVTVPINYFSRYLYNKYGALIKTMIGDYKSDSKQHVPGVFELIGKRMLDKDAFENVNLPPEIKREICKNVVNGSYTAMAMGMALLTYKNIKYDRDKKQYTIYGVPVTEKILHLPLMDTYLSYATTIGDIESMQGEKTAKDYVVTSLKNDYRQFKNMPFYNQLTYGYLGNVLDATKDLAHGTAVKAWDEGEKGFGKLVSTYTAPPGFVREYAKQIDERIKNGEHLDPVTVGEMIKKDYPWLSTSVPTKEEKEIEKIRTKDDDLTPKQEKEKEEKREVTRKRGFDKWSKILEQAKKEKKPQSVIDDIQDELDKYSE